MFLRGAGTAVLLLSLSVQPFASTPKLDDQHAIKAIIGEAENQGYQGMYLVACAIRNRGTLKGVAGVNGKHVNKASASIWQQASKAWHESENGPDLTYGATIWQNSYDLNHSRMNFDKLDCTTIHGGHYFFKEIK